MKDKEFNRQYQAVRENGAGIWNYSTRGLIEVSGAEAVQFLNGLITNDVKALENGSWMLAAFPNAQGRLLAIVRVLRKDDKFWFDTGAVTREKVFQNLFRFTMAGDFQVHDLSDEYGVLSVQGKKAEEFVAKILGENAANIEKNKFVETEFNGETISVIRASHLAENGFDLFVPTSEFNNLWQAFKEIGAIEIGDDLFEVLRIEAGTPRYGADMDETTVVLETGLDEAVNFQKGCYIGQEIIARIHFRGHVAKKLTGLTLEDLSESVTDGFSSFELTDGLKNAELKSLEGKNAGRITSATFSPSLGKLIALAYVRYDYLAEGTELKVNETTAKVKNLPFV
ncbi:MAG TPA: aminomethyltransferase family protein [Pyrinomonadaceae bacterium]|nr:aminomethyltransferase family protein [Pyrinomonadaceae bacterium]